MKKLILSTTIAATIIGCSIIYQLNAQNSMSDLHVQWLGYVVYATSYDGVDPGILGGNPLSQHTDTIHEIGLRSDGVVVWRDSNKNYLQLAKISK